MQLQEKLNQLRLKKAQLFAKIEMLSEVSESMFIEFGKVEAEIMQLEKEIIRQSKNFLDED